MKRYCPVCEGLGEVNFCGVECEDCGGGGEFEDYCELNDLCVECEGKGVVEVDGVELDCVKCEGQGTFKEV